MQVGEVDERNSLAGFVSLFGSLFKLLVHKIQEVIRSERFGLVQDEFVDNLLGRDGGIPLVVDTGAEFMFAGVLRGYKEASQTIADRWNR